jgi:cytosine/adenosine deaminase-related metal-dependent hydrolase
MTVDVQAPAPVAGRPVVLRGGTVLTMDAARSVLLDADVLVIGDRIAAVGPRLEVPEGTQEVDARGGIVMPGMIDTHRHMWQTAMRGYGADWTLTQYFVWYYLEHGKVFRPEDVHAGNLLGALEAIDAGVTTTVDWSHGLQTVDHAEAAVDALQAVPGRFVLAYGNIQAGPWEWATDPAVQRFLERRRTGAGICWASSSPSTSPVTRASRRRPPSRRPASWGCRSPPTPASGGPPTTPASGSCTSTGS